MNMVKKFKDLVVGDIIYGFNIDDQDYNAPGDICTVEVLDIDREEDLVSVYVKMKSIISSSGNKRYYINFYTEGDWSYDRQVDHCFATTEADIKTLHEECIKESIKLHERSISELRNLFDKNHGHK